MQKIMIKIPFNKISYTGKELEHIAHALNGESLENGIYTKNVRELLEKITHSKSALLTNSCTQALEMAAILLDIKPGDEIIMPSFTFVSTANAFVLRGAIPVFVDIRRDTLNLDEDLIEKAITTRTKAIVPVHYAGVSCNLEKIQKIASENNLKIIEDAAQGLMAYYKKQPLGSFGSMAALSFHHTKNITCGLGGALLINDENYIERANQIWQKGTNREEFLRDKTDKYTWVDIGSSFLASEVTAAFLYAQLLQAESITQKRLSLWNMYHELLKPLEKEGLIKRPTVPQESEHNAHMYYLLIQNNRAQDFIAYMKTKNIAVTTHYVPLHSSIAGKKYARSLGKLPVTDEISQSLIRLPLWNDLTKDAINTIVQSIRDFSW